jgi:H+/Cl- antiporter ClcA
MALHNRLLSDNSEKDDISAITAVAGIAGGLVAVFGAPVAAVGLVAASVIDGMAISLI